jgi:NAD(P)-dependent dehydrogenase (short-subunit alcohol dehydrogenase family)
MNPTHPQRVLVTGAAVRIGHAIALRFARGGAAVAVHFNRSEAEARQLLAELERLAPGAGHRPVRADLRNPQERERLIPDLAAAGFVPDCLVNNASTYRRCALRSLTPEQLQDDFDVNFVAPFQLMRDFARTCRRGAIVNLLDQRVAGVDPGAGAYGLAKKALRDATEAAALEWAPEIRVNGVAPGFVLPPPGIAPEKMAKFIPGIPMRRTATPDEIAEACWFLAATPAVTGQILFVDGGLHLTANPVAEKTPE